MVWRKLEDGNRKAYAGALHKFLRYSMTNGFLSPRDALKGRMLQVARDGQYESPVKALLSGPRLAEKMSIIPVIVALADWLFAESLERVRHRETHGTSDGVKGTSFAGLQRERTRGSGRSLGAWEWSSYRSQTDYTSEKRGQYPRLEMVSSALWGRSRGVDNMNRTLGHGHRVGCGSSRRNVKNEVW